MLEFQHVSVSCQRTPILKDISVSFRKGEITAVIGPNGCGKTTLMQCLNGSSTVTAGRIFLDGKDYLKIPLRKRATKLAFLPQVRTVIPTLPVRTLVEHGRFPYLGFYRKKTAEDIAIVNRSMELVHVEQYSSQYADTLSGGIRQRVFFALALAQDCGCLVLDEPTTYLDLAGQRDFFSLLHHLKEQGKTIVLVLHDLGQAVRTADRLVVMKDRQIAATGTPEECLSGNVIQEVFHTRWKKFTDEEGTYYFFE